MTITLVRESDAADFRLQRLIEWAGFKRSDFQIVTTGENFDYSTLDRSGVLMPLGNSPTIALLGNGNILTTRGYIYQSNGAYVLPTVDPWFVQRGNGKWSAAFISDLQKAVELVRLGGPPPQFTNYTLDPSPAMAYQWACDYRNCLRGEPGRYLAFDIETPGKPDDEDEADPSEDLPDQTWHIERIGFSYGPLQALSIPWEPPFFAAIRLLLDSDGPKVVWNAGFDVPRVSRAGFPAMGTIHDGMVAWHILHSDLPKRLGFVATFTCPWQPAWKHLSSAKPAYYNATDADVEWRSMEVIERELRRVGLWDVYQRDVIDLQPVLDHMSKRGMRVDPVIRVDRATRLSKNLIEVKAQLEQLVPIEARRIDHVFVKPPAIRSGLLTRKGIRSVPVCTVCGIEKPTKHHFRVLKKTTNPCANAGVREVEREVDEFYRLAEFKLSRNLLISYHNHFKRPLPLVWDKKQGRKKVSFDQEQMKKLILKYPGDKLYPLVLQYRSLDKLAGTYIGRLEESHIAEAE